MDDTSARPNPDSPRAHIPLAARVVATALFAGYAPVAPGTAGSLVGLAAYLLIPGMHNPLILSLAAALGFAAGVPAAGTVARIVGHELARGAEVTKRLFQPDPGKTHAADPSIVVIDEVAGMWIALLFLPGTPVAAGLAFLAFRIFDVVKPFPAQHVERYPNGWGIMLDDVIAGIYANITVRAVLAIISATTTMTAGGV